MANIQATPLPQAFSGLLNIRDWRLLPRLMAATLLLVMVSLGISGYDSITSSRAALLAQGALNLKASSSHTTAAIEAYLLANRNAIAAASALPDTVAFATDPTSATAKSDVLKTLKKFKTQFDYESVELINLQGSVILDTGDQVPNLNVKSVPYFTEAVKGIVGYVSDPSISEVTNRPALFFSAPVFDAAGNVLAVISARENLYKLWAIVEKDWEVAGPGTAGILLDQYGLRIAHSSSVVNREGMAKSLFLNAVAPVPVETARQLVAEKRFGNGMVEKVPVLALPEVADAMTDLPSATFESSGDGSPLRHYASLSSLAVKPWRYVVMTPLPTFTRPADELAAHYLLILALAGIVTGLFAYVFARAITRPIVHLTHVADRISMGELDIEINVDQKDEIGELAESFGRMQASMQEAIYRLRSRKQN